MWFKKKIILINKKFVQDIIFRHIYLKKTNFIYYKSIKRNINVLYTNATTKIKWSKLNIESAQKIKLIAKSIPILTLKLNILATLNNIVDSNQIAAIVTSPFLDIITDIYLIIYKKKTC